MGMGHNANGNEKLASYPSMVCDPCTLGPYRQNLPHVLGDIIIWSPTLAEHHSNVSRILEALQTAHLYCSLKKSNLFATEMDFLGHHISEQGIEVDSSKVDQILNWPAPSSAKHVRQFLGLVHYIASFLPMLAEHTSVLTPLMKKECNARFPKWGPQHQHADDTQPGNPNKTLQKSSIWYNTG
jgi:hypothetical protein